MLIGIPKHQQDHDSRRGSQTAPVNLTQPHGNLIQPVFSTLDTTGEIVGYIMGIMAFDAYLINLLPDGVRGVLVVFESTCGDKYTYELNGSIVSTLCIE